VRRAVNERSMQPSLLPSDAPDGESPWRGRNPGAEFNLRGDCYAASRQARTAGRILGLSGYQPSLPSSPFMGPTIRLVTQPP
jgi:hypothetical protein